MSTKPGEVQAGDGRAAEYEGALKAIEGLTADQIQLAQREQIRVIKSAVDATSDAAHSNIRNYRNWLLIASIVVVTGLAAVAGRALQQLRVHLHP